MQNLTLRFVFMVAIVSVTTAMAAADVAVPKADDVLKTLDRGHPRLFLKDPDLEALKRRAATDATLARYVRDMIRQADRYIGREPVKYRLIGPRLLSVSRECLNRVVTCALAYRWTGQKKYAKTALENMLAACEFKDWHPPHYLDTAEMTNAVGIGYDWLFDYMDAATRRRVRQGIIQHGLEQGVRCYTGGYNGRDHWFVGSEFNWNQVCNGGMIVGALAVAETDPKYARIIIPAAVESLPRALKSYAPDGAWGEGPGYWHYATRYTAYGIDALRTALGTDFGLLDVEGLSSAGLAPIHLTGPTNMVLSYADCHAKSKRRPMACMFWLAGVYEDPVIAAAEQAVLARHSASLWHVVWYVPPVDRARLAGRPLDKLFRGRVPVVVFRSAWDDPQALFVGVKAGYNQVNHGHLDLGNFELDALGVRWALDLGGDDYNMPGYWSGGRNGRRWTYYRLNSLSHNVPLIDRQNQDPLATAALVEVRTGGEAPYAIMDLTEAYKPKAAATQRGVAMVGQRRAVLIQDEFEIAEPCTITWGMTTEAEISIDSDGSARLRQAGKELIARILAPAGAGFSVESAEQKPPQASNRGVHRLVADIKAGKGHTRIAVLLSPVWPNGPVKTTPITPLSSW